MKKQSQHGKTNAEVGEDSTWYFVRLGLFAKQHHKKARKGTLFKRYYLIKASNAKSAIKKSEYMLSALAKAEKHGGRFKGKQVTVDAIGILDIEPLYHPLISGAEIFDETENGISLSDARKHALSSSNKRRFVAYEKKHGKPELIDVFWD